MERTSVRGLGGLEYLCLDNLEDLVFIIDADRKYVAIWGKPLQDFGRTPSDYLGHTIEEVIGTESSAVHVEHQRMAVRGETVLYEACSPAGESGDRWFQTRLTPISGRGDHIDYVLGVTQETSELHAKQRKLERTIHDVIRTMGQVVAARDPFTAGHEQGVARLAALLATEMHLSKDEIEGIETAALVHDIGKLHVPVEILSKPDRLSANEYALVQTHVEQSYDILRQVEFPWPLAEIALQHHERMDGTGYPNRLVGDQILLAARVIAVADVLEAMAAPRPYRPPLGMEAAVAEIREHPTKFDPKVAKACFHLYERGRLVIEDPE